MLLPTNVDTLVHSSNCAPALFNENNHTSSLLISAASIAIFSLGVGTPMPKSARANVPCLNIKKNPVLGLAGPVPSFLYTNPS